MKPGSQSETFVFYHNKSGNKAFIPTHKFNLNHGSKKLLSVMVFVFLHCSILQCNCRLYNLFRVYTLYSHCPELTPLQLYITVLLEENDLKNDNPYKF